MSIITWMLLIPLITTVAIFISKNSDGMARVMAFIGSLITLILGIYACFQFDFTGVG